MADSKSLTHGVQATEHARVQARDRFPGFKSARIVDEVRAALREGRYGPGKPPTLSGRPDPAMMYAWTPDMQRVYAIKANLGLFVVVTTMRADVETAAC